MAVTGKMIGNTFLWQAPPKQEQAHARGARRGSSAIVTQPGETWPEDDGTRASAATADEVSYSLDSAPPPGYDVRRDGGDPYPAGWRSQDPSLPGRAVPEGTFADTASCRPSLRGAAMSPVA